MSRRRGITTPIVSAAKTDVIQHGRNYIRANDLVKVGPSAPGKHDGFPALFKYADVDRGGLHYCVLALERTKGGRMIGAGYRFLKPERIRRTASTRDPRNA